MSPGLSRTSPRTSSHDSRRSSSNSERICRRMQRAIGIGLLLLVGLLVPRLAEANILCRWFGYCVYESPGFRIAVADRETGRPLADVPGLAEWQMYGPQGRNGPLMVQDAVTGSDGVIAPWTISGPLRP